MLARARSIHGLSTELALRRIMAWNAAMTSRASTSAGTPDSIAAIVTVSAFDGVSLPIVISRAMVLADGTHCRFSASAFSARRRRATKPKKRCYI
jgi:hypothetical protein